MLEIIFPSASAVVSITLLTLLGAVFGLILSVAKLKLKVYKDPRIDEILDVLPGANCGACSLPGCSAYATKIVEEKFDISLCPVGGAEAAEKIAGIMGVESSGGGVRMVARNHCRGGYAEATRKFIYNGPKDCNAAAALMGGFKTCEYGCLGFGDCAGVCPFDAIYMSDNGLPVIDEIKCVGCGKCVEICPRDIIFLKPADFDIYVMCKNKEKAPVMKQGCIVGCIGCKLCEKACREVLAKEQNKDPADIEPAIKVSNFLANIDYELCIKCYKCAEVCPVPLINPISKSKKLLDAAQKDRNETTSKEVEAVV